MLLVSCLYLFEVHPFNQVLLPVCPLLAAFVYCGHSILLFVLFDLFVAVSSFTRRCMHLLPAAFFRFATAVSYYLGRF